MNMPAHTINCPSGIIVFVISSPYPRFSKKREMEKIKIIIKKLINSMYDNRTYFTFFLNKNDNALEKIMPIVHY